MGEKIRDIHPIRIGDTSLMIELNEGYTSSDGRLIHIQNEKYRYLLKEKDFHHLAAMVMRAWSEFTYYKYKKTRQRSENDFVLREPVSEGTTKCVNSICQALSIRDISYRLLDVQNRLITIIIHEADEGPINDILKELGGHHEIHPFGERNGYVFLYLMKPFLLYRLNNIYIELVFQLPCASLTPKTWIPLDRLIQSRTWQIQNISDGLSWLEPISRYIYHLCWGVFFNKGFSTYQRQYLHDNCKLLDDSEMQKCLKVVFFNYTDQLIELLKKDCFDEIIPNYYTFKNY